MKRLMLFILPVLMIGLVACQSTFVGSGKIVIETRNVSGVSAVRLMTSGDLTIEQGAQESLSIEAEDSILPELTSDVVGGTLELSSRSLSNLNLHSPIRYHLVVKEIHGLTLMGSGDVNASTFSGDSVTITVLGSGNTSIEQLNAKSLTVNIEGSGDVKITSGNADEATIKVLGSGNFTADNVKLGKTNISVLGSGDSRVWITTQLDVSFLGSGDVSYFGKPSISESHLGSGNLISLGAK